MPRNDHIMCELTLLRTWHMNRVLKTGACIECIKACQTDDIPIGEGSAGGSTLR